MNFIIYELGYLMILGCNYNIVYNSDIYRKVKGEMVPVYVALGLILMSTGFGLYTAIHQLTRAPNVHVKKSRRETLPEVVEPERAVEEADRFRKKSFFRKVAHVQDFELGQGIPDPIRGEVIARYIYMYIYMYTYMCVSIN